MRPWKKWSLKLDLQQPFLYSGGKTAVGDKIFMFKVFSSCEKIANWIMVKKSLFFCNNLFHSKTVRKYKFYHQKYDSNLCKCKSRHRRCSVENGVFKNLTNFTGKHLFWGLSLIKRALTGLRQFLAAESILKWWNMFFISL